MGESCTAAPAACDGDDDGSGTDEACTADAVTQPVTDCTFTAGDAGTCGAGCTYAPTVAGAACALNGDASGCAVVGGNCAYAATADCSGFNAGDAGSCTAGCVYVAPVAAQNALASKTADTVCAAVGATAGTRSCTTSECCGV